MSVFAWHVKYTALGDIHVQFNGNSLKKIKSNDNKAASIHK